MEDRMEGCMRGWRDGGEDGEIYERMEGWRRGWRDL